MYFCVMKKDEYLVQFGKYLRTLRKERVLTQLDLAVKGGFDRNYIGMLERGERNPSLLNLIRLADALEISIYELMKFEIDEHNKNTR